MTTATLLKPDVIRFGDRGQLINAGRVEEGDIVAFPDPDNLLDDEEHEVLDVRGRSGRYLDPARGTGVNFIVEDDGYEVQIFWLRQNDPVRLMGRRLDK